MSDSSENENEGSDTEVAAAARKIVPVNNVPALQAKLKSVQLNLDWVEKLDISVNIDQNDDMSADPADKAENDFKREMIFYNQALGAASKALKRLKKMDIATKRPPDFFAEMAKSDSHMNKVREKLHSKQTAVERREKVREMREHKKKGKKIQQEIIQSRKTEKKKMISALKKTKKGKMSADALLNEKKGFNEKKEGKKFNKGKSRETRDSKYGYGGKKKGSKWNTSESSSGMNFKNKKFGGVRKAKRRRR